MTLIERLKDIQKCFVEDAMEDGSYEIGLAFCDKYRRWHKDLLVDSLPEIISTLEAQGKTVADLRDSLERQTNINIGMSIHINCLERQVNKSEEKLARQEKLLKEASSMALDCETKTSDWECWRDDLAALDKEDKK